MSSYPYDSNNSQSQNFYNSYSDINISSIPTLPSSSPPKQSEVPENDKYGLKNSLESLPSSPTESLSKSNKLTLQQPTSSSTKSSVNNATDGTVSKQNASIKRPYEELSDDLNNEQKRRLSAPISIINGSSSRNHTDDLSSAFEIVGQYNDSITDNSSQVQHMASMNNFNENQESNNNDGRFISSNYDGKWSQHVQGGEGYTDCDNNGNNLSLTEESCIAAEILSSVASTRRRVSDNRQGEMLHMNNLPTNYSTYNAHPDRNNEIYSSFGVVRENNSSNEYQSSYSGYSQKICSSAMNNHGSWNNSYQIRQPKDGNPNRNTKVNLSELLALSSEIFDPERIVVDEEEVETDEENRVPGPINGSGTFENISMVNKENRNDGFPPTPSKGIYYNNNVNNVQRNNKLENSSNMYSGSHKLKSDSFYEDPNISNSIPMPVQSQINYKGSTPFYLIQRLVNNYMNNPKYRSYRLFAQQPLLAQKSYGEERRFFLPPQLSLYGFTRTAQAFINIYNKPVQGIVEQGFVTWKRMYIPSSVTEKEVSVSYTVINGNITYNLPAPPIAKLSKPSKRKQSPSIPSGDLIAFYLRTRNSQHYLTAKGPTSLSFWDFFIVEGDFRYGEIVSLRNKKGSRVVNLRPVLDGKSLGDIISPLGKVVLEGVDEPIQTEVTRDDWNQRTVTSEVTAGIWTVVPVAATSLTFHVPSPVKQEIFLPRITRMERTTKYLIIYGISFPKDVWVFVNGEPMSSVEVFDDCLRCWAPYTYRGKIHMATSAFLVDCGVIED